MAIVDTSQDRVNDFYARLKARAGEITDRYRSLSPSSAELFERAKGVEPGGFTRDAVLRKPYALFVERGEGGVLIDCDGRRITDMWFNATSLPLGHAHPHVVAAAGEQIRKGASFFARTESEIELAAALCERLLSAERVRFANSGSEAVMMALRIARGFSGRDLVVKFEGCYHGTYDDVMWSVSTPKDQLSPTDDIRPVATSSGLPGPGGRTMVLPYDDPEILRRVVKEHHQDIAAIIIEPMSNRIGMVVPSDAFLKTARELCDEFGVVLVFDEVIAFRIGYRGAQGYVGVTPDLTTLGKVIGGGFAVGAVAGRADVMAITEPYRAGRVAHFGTFNANPVTMTAGKATLDVLTPDAIDDINAKGARVREALEELCAELPLRITGVGSFFKIDATTRTIRNHRDTVTRDTEWEEVASLSLLNDGFMLTTGLQGALSTATTEDQMDSFLAAFAELIRY